MRDDPDLSEDVALNRLRWRCRRGMKELDVLLERWLARDAAGAPAATRVRFEGLLALPDPELAEYLLKSVAHADPLTEALLCRLREA